MTRGTGIANAVFDGYRPWAGEIRARHTGSLVSDRTGKITPFALTQLSDRGQFFVEPGEDTYEGQVVGINPRAEDLDINVDPREEAHQHALVDRRRLRDAGPSARTRPRTRHGVLREDECVEVTPEIVRVRKVELDATMRGRAKARAKARG